MKAVFFDFDGTLTHKSKNIWQKIWSRLGYDLGEGSLYRKLYEDVGVPTVAKRRDQHLAIWVVPTEVTGPWHSGRHRASRLSHSHPASINTGPTGGCSSPLRYMPLRSRCPTNDAIPHPL